MLKIYIKPRCILLSFKRLCSTALVPEDGGEVPAKKPSKFSKNVKIFMHGFGFDYDKSYRFALKHKKLGELDEKYALKTIELLKLSDIDMNDLESHIELLKKTPSSLRNRLQILQECGFSPIRAEHLQKYLTLRRHSVATLKTYGLIPSETDVLRKLLETYKTRTSKVLPESETLETFRAVALSEFLAKTLGFTEEQVQKVWMSYNRIKLKSATSIVTLTDLVTRELGFSHERIQKNIFVLDADPENVQRILALDKIAGNDARELLSRVPKIMMTPAESIQEIVSHTEAFNIPGRAISLCPQVLSLSPSTVLERLQDIRSIPEFEFFFDNPRILKLVVYQQKAKSRLSYIQQHKLEDASLHILSHANEVFERYIVSGYGSAKGFDVRAFLARKFGKRESEIQKLLSRHESWSAIPRVVVKRNFTYLSTLFSQEDLLPNICLLFYPHENILEKLEYVESHPEFGSLAACQKLSLCLYFLEIGFNFTGNGVWAGKPVENDLLEQPEAQQPIDPISFGAKKTRRKTKSVA